ncbi:MAG: radical SAM/SPASM domain-containing protein [Anaerolineaceae bacterium]
MFDIEFYMKVWDLKKRVMAGEKFSREYLVNQMESFRSPDPVVYNIETTNACNMRCEMCPRTTMMTRPVVTMKPDLFNRVIDQLKPFTAEQWARWEKFALEKYGYASNDMSENHYFLYVIPRVIVLHGYGDPLLDKNMPDYIKAMTARGLESYFSCNPANINMDRTIETFENGLGYVKYSMESVDDIRHKEVRGSASNFSDSYKNILKLLEVKAQRNLKTTIVITMINLNKPWQQEEFAKLKEAFKGCDVYVYLKSQDQQWYEDNKNQTQSIHWLEFCQFPWSSMTVKSNGESVECVEDFNNEIILGDAHTESLYDIWNGQKYRQFRQDHFDLTPGIKCTEQCDMRLIGSFLAS